MASILHVTFVKEKFTLRRIIFKIVKNFGQEENCRLKHNNQANFSGRVEKEKDIE